MCQFQPDIDYVDGRCCRTWAAHLGRVGIRVISTCGTDKTRNGRTITRSSTQALRERVRFQGITTPPSETEKTPAFALGFLLLWACNWIFLKVSGYCQTQFQRLALGYAKDELRTN